MTAIDLSPHTRTILDRAVEPGVPRQRGVDRAVAEAAVEHRVAHRHAPTLGRARRRNGRAAPASPGAPTHRGAGERGPSLAEELEPREGLGAAVDEDLARAAEGLADPRAALAVAIGEPARLPEH